VVFDRSIGDEVLVFGVSGLVCNSNLLMYDRRGAGDIESLWSQLSFKAISGPAAARGEMLKLVPATVLPWSEWQRLHPNTKILKLDISRLNLYKQTFQHYYGSDELKFPASPLPNDGLPRKTAIIACATAPEDRAHWRIFSQPQIAAALGAGETPGFFDRRFRIGGDPQTFWLETGYCAQAPVITIHSFWFAWYAQHPPE
jgi:hypothetical protein